MKVADLKNLFKGEEKGVSPVIGVILMVAVTVILAAVIGAFVMNMGDNLSQSAPQANFNYDWDANAQSLEVTHDGGDSFTDKNTKSLAVQVGSDEVTWVDDSGAGPGSYDIAAGDSIAIDADGTGSIEDSEDSQTSSAHSSGDEVRILWESNSGDSSQTVGTYTIP